jgi:hypothetical protein
VGLACMKGVGQRSGDHSCPWIAGLAGFRGMVPAEIMQACVGVRGVGQQNGNGADLCRPEVVALWRSCLCVDRGLCRP